MGDDSYGKFIDEDFIHHGLDTSYLKKREGKTTNFDIVLSNRETMGRCILYYPGTAEQLQAEELPLEYLTNTKYLFISMLNPVVDLAVDIARKAGAKIFIDADSDSEELRQMIPKIDVFVASEFVYNAMFDGGDRRENCKKVMELGPEIVVFTFGEKGCIGMTKGGYFEVPAYKMDVVDTVGAGDVYHGAFLAGLLKGYSAEYTAKLASAVSAIKCTRIGGRAGIPDLETAQHFMETGVIDYTDIDARVEFYKRGI